MPFYKRGQFSGHPYVAEFHLAEAMLRRSDPSDNADHADNERVDGTLGRPHCVAALERARECSVIGGRRG